MMSSAPIHSLGYSMEPNTAVANLVPLTGLLDDRETLVPAGSVGVVIEAAKPAVVIVDFDGVLVSAAVNALLPLVRHGLPIRKYRLADLLQQMPDVGDDEDFEQSN